MDSASASPAEPGRRSRRPAAATRASEQRRSGRPASEIRVLILDDDDDTRDVLTLFLTGEGYDVYPVASGAEAIAVMTSMREPPDLALIDIVMPEMSGFDVIEEMRRTPRLARVPVAVVSGLPRATYHGQDVAAWLLKPPPVGELLDAVARLTGR